MLSSTTWQVIVFGAAWVGTGLATAGWLSRRGHEFGPNAALGVVLGPIFIFLALDMKRYRESEQPIVVTPAREKAGTHVLVVAVGELEDRMAARAAVESLEDVGSVTAAVTVEYEVEQRVHGMGGAPPDSKELNGLANLLSGFSPGRMMLPGQVEKSIREGVEEAGAGVVVIVGSGSATVAPGLEESLKANVLRVDTVTN